MSEMNVAYSPGGRFARESALVAWFTLASWVAAVIGPIAFFSLLAFASAPTSVGWLAIGLVGGTIELGVVLILRRAGRAPQRVLFGVGIVLGVAGWMAGFVWFIAYAFFGDSTAVWALLFPLPGAFLVALAFARRPA